MPLNLSSVRTHIQKQVSPNSLTNSCSGEGCKVDHDGVPPERVVINVEIEFDARRYNRKRSDRLMFYGHKNTFVAVPIELTGRGKGEESQVLEQLKNSLEFAATLAQDLKKTVYVPIVLTKNGIRWTNPRRQNQELKLTFKGKTLRVLTGRCGRPKNLANLLSNAGYL